MSGVCFSSVLCLAPCKVIGDSLGSWIPRFGFQILGSGFQFLSVEPGFGIPIACGIPIPWAVFSHSKTQDSGFHKQKFLVFSYVGRIVRLRFSLYWIKIVLGRRITRLPELQWACQLPTFLYKTLQNSFSSVCHLKSFRIFVTVPGVVL